MRETIRREPNLSQFWQAERMMYLLATIKVNKFLQILVGQDALRCVAPIWDHERKSLIM